MLITALELYQVAMPLRSPWRTAHGDEATVETVLVRIESGEHVAWAESCPGAMPCYSPEWAGGAFAALQRWLAPALVGQSIDSGADLQRRLAHFTGNYFAKAALDNAWWVLAAARQGLPLHRLLGGDRDRVEAGADIGVLDSVGELIEQIGAALAAGFSRIKLKIRPGWDADVLRMVRQAHPAARIHVDCNAGYTFDDLPLFARLDDFGLEMIEQPLMAGDLIDHARLQAQIRTPICLDESITSAEVCRVALDLGSCRVVNIKPGRVGGLTEALAIHEVCRQAGVVAWVGGMLESAIGARIALALATLPGCTYPADVFPSSRFYEQDLASPALELADGSGTGRQIATLAAPGIGTEPDPQRLQSWCVNHARLEAK
ncbi:MAG: o-succinylbenzoate synthase [Planctomycetaceae bacterium]|nr:o-succinylbenzoate synthase [Planctomycetaceae bacterium]